MNRTEIVAWLGAVTGVLGLLVAFARLPMEREKMDLEIKKLRIELERLSTEVGQSNDRVDKRIEAVEKTTKALESQIVQAPPIRLVDFQVSPRPVRRGGKLTLSYTIESKSDTPIEVWLGANLQDYSGQMLFYNTREDEVVTVKPGRHTYTRFLTIGVDVPGIYQLAVEVWRGQKSMPMASILLAQWPALKIKVE